MLKECAPGHELMEADHYWHVRHRGVTFDHLPKGKHSQRRSKRADLEFGHVRALARQLGIEECARKYLPQLGH